MFKMFALKLLFLIIAVTLRLGLADECVTPNNETAVCISIYSCPVLSKVISDPTNREFIIRSNCGGTPIEPKVCCGSYSNFTSNECVTPNNETAVCISIYSCPVLSKAISDPTNREFIIRSNCGGTPIEPKVCCGSYSNFTAAEKGKYKPALTDLLPSPKICGIQHSDEYFHTVNDTGINEFPWLALITYYKEGHGYGIGSNFGMCSGSLVSARYVLTSAMCLTMETLTPTGVRLGDYHLSNETDCIQEFDLVECNEPVEDFGIEKFISHPDYVWPVRNNVGLIRLNRTVTYSDYIRPICLPLPGTKQPEVDDILFTSGWGVTRTDDSMTIKKKSYSRLITNKECEEIYHAHDIMVKLTDAEMCTASDPSVCNGDWGGPIMYSHKARWYQVGIISAVSCGHGFPNGYPAVARYIDWIEEYLEP